MSNKIDWDKAPEGATHWEPKTANVVARWMRLEDGKWFFWPISTRDASDIRWYECRNDMSVRSEYMIPRPTTKSWSGEGLPPVGVVCMAGCERVVIVAHHCNGIHAIYAESESDGLLYYGEPNEFRPIRTPEQIAADEREAAIDEMLAATPAPGSDISLRVCEKLYDAGYRKP